MGINKYGVDDELWDALTDENRRTIQEDYIKKNRKEDPFKGFAYAAKSKLKEDPELEKEEAGKSKWSFSKLFGK